MSGLQYCLSYLWLPHCQGWQASNGTRGRTWGLLSLLPGASSSFRCSIGHMVITLCGALITPNLNFWGGNVDPLSMKMVRWMTGKVVPLPFEGQLGCQQKDAPTREYLPEGCLARSTLVEGKLLVEELDPQMDLKPASYEIQAQMQWGRAWIWWGFPHPAD